MRAPRFIRFLSVTIIAALASAVGMQNAFAQWTFRAAPQPLIRNITVTANSPAAGTNTLIVSTLTDGMYKGTDNGTTTTWQKISNGIPIVQVRTHATVGTTDIYAATEGAGLFKTIDGGANWSAINGSGANALGCLDVRSVSVVVATPTRTLLVSTFCRNNSGVYRSIDDGANWTRLGPAAGMPGSLPADIRSNALLRFNSGAINIYFLATSNYGIFKSSDDGATWATANNGISGLNAFNVTFNGTTASDTSKLLVYVQGSGIYSSTDSGANWTLSNAGLPANFAGLGGINRESALVQYIGLDKQGVYKTTDGGVNWAAWGATAGDDDAKYTRGINAVTGVAGLYYLATLEGVVKTTNNGVNLQAAGQMPGGRINAMTHDRDAPSAAYIAIKAPVKINYIYGDYTNNALFTSLETGVTGAANEGVVYQDRLAPTTLYVVTNNRGIFKSTNSGASFTAINSGLPNMIGQTNRLAIDPTNSQILYLGLSDAAGVFKSINGGASWLPSNSGLSTPQALSINVVTVDGNDPTIVWLATAGGVYKSTNSGAAWTLKYSAVDGSGSILPSATVRVRLGSSNDVYIANRHINANGTLTATSGILKSIDGGTTWTNILQNLAASQVRVTASGDIYAGISAAVGNPAVYLSTNGGVSFAPYSTNLAGSDIRSFGFAADESALISLSLENGFYTNNAVVPVNVPLTVNKVGTGTVTSSPVGIDCGVTCTTTVVPGTAVTLTATSLMGSVFTGWSGGGCTGTGACTVTVSVATTVTATFSGGPFSLLTVQSRKTHGTAGTFDLPIDSSVGIGGAVTVESRIIGAGHSIVFQFSGPVTSVSGVTSRDATSNPVGTATFAIVGNDVMVTLTGVPDNRRANITVSDVNASLTPSAAIGFLVGDVNNTRSVTASDISSVKARSGQSTTALNFKFDVNVTGAINAADISAVKARSGLALP